MSTAPDPAAESPKPRVAMAMAAGAVLAGAICAVVALSAGPAAGAGLFVPLAAAAVLGARRLATRHDVERTDERAQLLIMRAKAQGYDALLGLLGGAAAYQWIAHGFSRNESLVDVLIGVLVVHTLAFTALRRQI